MGNNCNSSIDDYNSRNDISKAIENKIMIE